MKNKTRKNASNKLRKTASNKLRSRNSKPRFRKTVKRGGGNCTSTRTSSLDKNGECVDDIELQFSDYLESLKQRDREVDDSIVFWNKSIEQWERVEERKKKDKIRSTIKNHKEHREGLKKESIALKGLIEILDGK